MVEPFLEEKTLEVCFEKKKIYIADLKYLGEIECTDGRKVSFCLKLRKYLFCNDLYYDVGISGLLCGRVTNFQTLV